MENPIVRVLFAINESVQSDSPALTRGYHCDALKVDDRRTRCRLPGPAAVMEYCASGSDRPSLVGADQRHPTKIVRRGTFNPLPGPATVMEDNAGAANGP